MAVQMILGNVCDRTCRRMELFDGFQLEAADLGNRYGIICRVECCGCVRGSDVSDHFYFRLICFHDLAEQRCCCGLSVGTGNRKHFSAAYLIRQLHFTDDRDLFFFHFKDNRQIRRNARA